MDQDGSDESIPILMTFLLSRRFKMFPTGISLTTTKRTAFIRLHRCGSTKIRKLYRLSKFLLKSTDHSIISQSILPIASSKDYKRARIRTSNPDRHILLERGLDDVVEIDDDLQFFRLMVIFAEMKESEYDDNDHKWMRKMNYY
ncbi:unnamed protein product [Caenorhabditis nigoni]